MSKSPAVILTGTENYDNCLISSCLKKLFTKTTKAAGEPSLVVFKSVSEIREQLEGINKSNIPELSYEYLDAMEQSIEGAAFRYAFVYRDGIPVLFIYFQIFTLTSRNFSLEQNTGFAKSILRFFLDLKNIKVLIAGNALRNDTACYCYREASVSKEATTEIIASAAEKIATDESAAAVILKDIAASGKMRKWLKGIGYHMPWEDKVMVMDIDQKWNSLASYTADLSRKYKTRANKIINAGKALTVRVLSESEVHTHQAAINKLFKNVAGNQSFVLLSPTPDHFAALKKVYKEDFEVIGFFHEQKLVAFSSAFVTSNAYEVYYIGFDYGHNSEYQLYFNILFTGLSRAIALKKAKLKLGRTSFDAKASIGAKPADVDYLIKMVTIPTIVSKWFINYFSSMEDGKWKLRNPLKGGE